jgi:hypothetical protein
MKQAIVITLLASLILSACSSGPKMFYSEKTPGVDFKQYKTYAWMQPQDTAFTKYVNKRALEKALGKEVIAQLTERKMHLDTVHPDCLFTYSLVLKRTYDVQQNQEVVYAPQTYQSMYSTDPDAKIYYFSSDNRPEVYAGKTQITTLREGTLVIDMVDAKTKNVVWRTTGNASKDEKIPPDLTKTASLIIPEMFNKFPVK